MFNLLIQLAQDTVVVDTVLVENGSAFTGLEAMIAAIIAAVAGAIGWFSRARKSIKDDGLISNRGKKL